MIPADVLASLTDEIDREFIVPPEHFNNTEGTRDNFRQYAMAAGDLNPLWSDDLYARKTHWGGVTAPPGWLTTVVRPAYSVRRLTPTGYDALDAEIHWSFVSPVRLGDTFSVRTKVLDVTEKTTRSLGPSLFARGSIEYADQSGNVFAVAKSSVFLYPPGASAARVAEVQPVVATPREEVVPYEEAISGLIHRGALTRYWESVEVGDVLAVQQRPTLTENEITQWLIGSHVWLLHSRPDGVPGDPAAPPHSSSAASSIPAPYDIGQQRSAWVGKFITDWMGDDARIVEFSCQFRGLIYAGDTPTCGGKVAAKYVQGADSVVELDLWVKNGLGQVKSPGRALVVLPSDGTTASR
jgi:acyl dehydratase